jgi:hypothetical protein
MNAPRSFLNLLLAFLIVGLAATVKAQSTTQPVTLNPGWNAVWLEVEPQDNATDAVFEDLEIGSVWTWLNPETPAEFIQSVSEAEFKQAGWQRWFPPAREESILNNLFRIQANRAYLIRFDGASPTVWTVTGRPSVRRPVWSPDGFSLRGLPVDPASPPTFLNFFRHSSAHFEAENSTLQPMFRLNSATGAWVAVAPTDPVQSGHAYWIFTAGASDYSAPLDLTLEIGDGLDFGLNVAELGLRIRNFRPTQSTALFTDSASAGTVLSHLDFDSVAGNQWLPLSAPLALPVASAGEVDIDLAVRRQDQTIALKESVLDIRDGAGTRHRVPVSSQKLGVPASGTTPSATPLAGLWVGAATLNAVSEAHSSDPSTPTPTPSELSLRMILHVDAGGQVRLLKEVTQMWRDGTFTTGPGGGQVIDQPGEYVLLTDDSLIPQFSGAVARDSETAGRRLSTVGYDFPSTPAANFLGLTGSFGIGGNLAGTLLLPADHPTNPFKHKYHPDHDNLNERFDGPAEESFDVTRQIALSFAAAPPTGRASVDFGYNEMAGSYRETITGIHKNALQLEGTFFLRRLTTIAELNPAPNP